MSDKIHRVELYSLSVAAAVYAATQNIKWPCGHIIKDDGLVTELQDGDYRVVVGDSYFVRTFHNRLLRREVQSIIDAFCEVHPLASDMVSFADVEDVLYEHGEWPGFAIDADEVELIGDMKLREWLYTEFPACKEVTEDKIIFNDGQSLSEIDPETLIAVRWFCDPSEMVIG